MRPLSPKWRRTLLILLGAVILIAGFLIWGVRSIISRQLRARYAGNISYSSWWTDGSESGLNGLSLNETPSASSPVWATVDRVKTDLNIIGMVTGHVSPERITFLKPKIAFRLGQGGEVLTRPHMKHGGPTSSMPAIDIESARLTIHQEGRPEMVVEPIFGTLTPSQSGVLLDAETDSSVWGKWTASGQFQPGFVAGKITLKSAEPIVADGKKSAMIPFVPEVVWDHVAPRGPVKVAINVTTGSNPSVVTHSEFLGTILILTSLDLAAENATGRMTVADRIVKIQGVKGKALGGEVAADGTLDFSVDPPKFDLVLNLKRVAVSKTPKSWQLAESGISGDLTGTVLLKVRLTKDGADLTGSEGSGVVENASLGGVAVKTLKLAMKANGDDIQYRTESKPVGLVPIHVPFFLATTTLMIQAPQDPPKPKNGGFVLPKTISTEVEFEDVDLVQLVTKARSLGIPLPFAMSGKLSLKAKATIPMGTIRDLKLYAFHGQAQLKAASINGVDLGAIAAKVDLQNGVLDLTELRGRFVDHPTGNPANPPIEVELAAFNEPLHDGGFRGKLHAEISPPGKFTVMLEGNKVPLGELLAPALPRPTPVSGLVSFTLDTNSDVAHLDDPKAWTASGEISASAVRYRETTLDHLSTSFALKNSKFNLPNFAAMLEGQPLKAQLALDATAPYRFAAALDTINWDLDALLAFVPSMPRPAPIGGRLTVHMKAQGTISPYHLAIDGNGLAKSFRAGPLALGDVPIVWKTEPDRIRVTIDDARPLGSSISAEADVPTFGDGPIRGSARFEKLDIATVSSALPAGSPAIRGRASGTGKFVVRPLAKPGESAIEANLSITSPELTVQGVPAKSLQAVLSVSEGILKVDLYLEGLGGKIEFLGNVAVTKTPLGSPDPEANATLRAVGFRLEGLWKPLEMGGAVEKLEGLAAIDANLRTHRSKLDLRARGNAEVRDLRWGKDYPIGTVKGIVTLRPGGWQVEPFSGDVLGGTARGTVIAETPVNAPHHLRFDLEVGRASLKKTLAFIPLLAAKVDGLGTLRLSGRVAESLRADGEFVVPSAKILGLPVQELRAPGELEFAPGGGIGSLRVRRWTARFAGGRLTGDARFGMGTDHSFQLDTQLNGIDLESLIRVMSDVRRPASGKVSGKIAVSGLDPTKLDRYRGRIDLELEDASVVELPIFRELDKFLGASRGGVFEDGTIHATIGNRQINVETLTLTGRLVQLHGSGTIGLDSRLDLIVLVNTNQIIGQTGQTLAALVPGLNDASGRRAGASARFGSFLANRLLKFRVTGTLSDPRVELDPAVAIGEGAIGFFAGVLKLPLGLLR